MRPSLHAALAAALILSAAGAASAQSPSRSLTADDAVREALAANRDLRAARLTIDVARGGLLQAGRLANPELDLGYTDDFAFAAEGESRGSIGFAQSFPVTARLAHEKNVASKDITIAEAEVRDFARTLIAEVETAFYTFLALDERIAVDRQLIESIGRVERVTKSRLEAAEVSPAELGLLRIERLRLEQDVTRLERERESAAAVLTRLLGRGSPEGLQLDGELDPGSMPLVGSADARPDLDAARARIDRADADRSLARSEVWEDWTLGLGYEREVSAIDGDDFEVVDRDQLLGVSLRVPLPLWNRRQGRIAAAEAERQRARYSREALELRIREEIRVAEARVRTLRSNVEAYAQEILPEASRARDLFDRGYRQGLVGIAELLQAQRQYNESRALYLELLGELRLAAIELEAAAASSPHLAEFQNQGATP